MAERTLDCYSGYLQIKFMNSALNYLDKNKAKVNGFDFL